MDRAPHAAWPQGDGVADPLLEAFEARLADDPEGLVVESEAESLSAAALDRLARDLQQVLGRPVAACLQTSVAAHFLAGILALRRAGAAVVLLDPASAPADVDRVVRALSCEILVTSQGNRFDVRSAGASGASVASFDRPLPEGTAFVRMTSGSTGSPRGVALTTAQVLADDAAIGATFALPGKRIVAGVPLAHAYGFSVAALPALASRAILVAPEAGRPLAPLDAARRFGADVLATAPAWLAAATRLGRGLRWPASLTRVISASAPLAPEIAAAFAEATGLKACVLYGTSETGGTCADASGDAALRGTVGAPLPGVSVLLEPALGSADEASRVVIESPAVGLSYVPRVDVPRVDVPRVDVPGAEVPRAEAPEGDRVLGGGRFVTSDLARWQGGELQLVGRIDDVINLRGRKVMPSSIESVVARIPGVREALALGVPSATSADRIRVVVACDDGLAESDVIAWCRSRLPEHEVPRSVVIVAELPRTDRGKLRRTELAAAFGGPA